MGKHSKGFGESQPCLVVIGEFFGFLAIIGLLAFGAVSWIGHTVSFKNMPTALAAHTEVSQACSDFAFQLPDFSPILYDVAGTASPWYIRLETTGDQTAFNSSGSGGKWLETQCGTSRLMRQETTGNTAQEGTGTGSPAQWAFSEGIVGPVGGFPGYVGYEIINDFNGECLTDTNQETGTLQFATCDDASRWDVFEITARP